MNRVRNGKVGVVNVCLGVQVGRSEKRNFESHEKNTNTLVCFECVFLVDLMFFFPRFPSL